MFAHNGHQLRRNGRFAVIGVAEASSAVTEIVGLPSHVEYLPLADDESHAGLFGYTADDFAVALELRALVQREDVHPAVSD